MKLVVAIVQFYFYCFWVISNIFIKLFFPIQNTFENIFPSKVKLSIVNLFIIDTDYRKKIQCAKNYKLKNLFKHPSYHKRSFIYIEYSISNLGHLDGTYLIIIRGGDRDSLIRTIQYLENADSFKEYVNVNTKQETFIDGQFVLNNLSVEVDQTSFFNKILGIDREGHKFLYIHHEIITLKDYWNMLCILNSTSNWYNEEVHAYTVDLNLNEKKILGNQSFFSVAIQQDT
jgi:hypothetical protein